MTSLILRRLAQAGPTLVVVSILMFILLMVGPNPLQQLKQNPQYTDKDIARLTKAYGWDKPKHEQYLGWAGNFVRGDLGTSMQTQRAASEMILERLPLTLMLTGASMLFSLIIAIPIGAYVAVRKYSKADYAATFGTFCMMATPSFFLALLLQLGALKLQDLLGGTMLFSTGGAPECVGASGVFSQLFACLGSPVATIQKMALPVTALSILQIAGWSRYQRSELLGVLNQDYVKAAMAKGLPGRSVFLRHAMRNALMPIVTIVAIDVALLFGGAVITETVFGLPGMGGLLFDSLHAKDSVVVLAIVMIGAMLVLVFNTLADIAYGMLDPRVRVS